MFKEWLFLVESKQSIIGLGYPEIIAKIFYEKFGNKAPLIAKWFKEANGNDNSNWWSYQFGGFGTRRSLDDYCKLYKATFNPEEYIRVRKQLELSETEVDEAHLREMRQALKKQIEGNLLETYFFFHQFIKDIMNGTLTDLFAYKDLPFREAWQKYEEKRIFFDKKPLKTYKNGFQWIDVGKKCPLVGNQLGNCGSVGVMSWDPDSTIITLFGPEKKPHVVVTYSPNEKRISGDEGGGSQAVKTKYHRYVIDLAETLGAKLDWNKSKSSLLGIKYRLKNTAQGIQQIRTSTFAGDSTFRFTIDGNVYYSNANIAVSAEDLTKMQQGVQNGEINLPIKNNKISDIFNWRNQDILRQFGIKYIPIDQLKTNTDVV